MARPSIKFDGDLTDIDVRRKLQNAIAGMRGAYHVKIEPANPKASNPQRGYYHAVICQALADYENEQQIEKWNAGMAHEAFKARILGMEEIRHADGRLLFSRPRSTAPYDTVEFTDYIEKCRAWLVMYCDWPTPDPDPLWRIHAAEKQAKRQEKQREAA